MPHPHVLKATLLALISGACYGTVGYFGILLIAAGLSVPTMLFWRFFLATLLILPVALPRLAPLFTKPLFAKDAGPKREGIKTMASLFLLGAIFYSSGVICYFVASERLGTGFAMILSFSYPAFVALFSWIIDRERPNRVTVLSIGAVIFGCILIADTRAVTLEIVGVMFAILSAVAYAIYIVASKKRALAVHPLLSTGIICMGNMMAFFVMAKLEAHSPLCQEGACIVMPTLPKEWFAIGAMAIISTILPIFLMLKSMKHLSANSVAILSVWEPIVTVIIGAALLHEPLSAAEITGGAFILCGAAMTTLRTKG